MPISVGKTTFAGGEFTPSLWPRTDLQKYATGARKLRNVIVHPHGGASNRPGSHYVATARYDGKIVRLLPFEFSTTQRYVIEAGDLYFRFATNDAQILSGGSPYQIVSAYAEAILRTLNFTQSADTLFIVCPTVKPKLLQRLGDTNWTLTDYDFKDGPFMIPNTDASKTLAASAVTGTITITASVDTFNAQHVGSLWQFKHYIEGQTLSVSLGAGGASSSIKCGGTWRIITHGTWTGKVNVEKSTDGGSSWTVIRTFASSNDNNVNTFGTDDNNGDPYLVRLNMTSYGSGTANIDLTTDAFYQVGVAKVTAYTDTKHVTATVTREIGATTATIDWAEGSWSDYRGWPASVVFDQDRLVFASTASEPQTTWMTETGNYYSFRRHSPLVDTDGISVNLPSRQLNAVNGLVPLLDLIEFTSSGEWTINSTTGNVLTPTTVQTRVNGYNGSSGVRPVVIGNRAIYVQASGNVIRDIGFELQSDGFVGSNISIISNHLFLGYNIVEMAYQQEPDSLVWAVRSDGIFLSMTYLREQDVVAWTWHETVGTYESVCVIQGNGYKEVWVSVKRGTKRFIERFDQRMASTKTEDQFFVDCGITYHDPKPITGATAANPVVITALSHGYSNGDLIDIADVGGMTQLNGKRYKVASAATNTFALHDADTGANINGSAYTAYTSGGTSSKAVNVITGLTHLEGQNVAVLADGNVVANYLNPKVVASGQITLDAPYSKVHVGYPYVSDIETLNVEIVNEKGTSQGKKVKISKLTLQILQSLGGWIGPNFDTLHEIADVYRATYGTSIPLYTGEVKEILGAGYEDGGRVCVRQYDPLPMSVLAIIPEVTVGGVSTVQ